jgi:N-acetylmuramoyl-L-alanine amidase
VKGTNKRTSRRLITFALLFFSLLAFAAAQPTIRVAVRDYEGYSRVLITFPSNLAFSLDKTGTFLQVRVLSGSSFRLRRDTFQSRLVKSFSWNKGSNFYILAVELQHSRFRYESFRVEKRRQLAIDFYETAAEPAEPVTPPAEKPPEELPRKEEPSAEAVSKPPAERPGFASPKSVRTIVIDPGHGGLEVGAKGKFGSLEKDITLGISLKLKALLERNLAFQVVLTRDKDLNVSLDNRAATANNHQAELFISIHANSSLRRNAAGSETYFLSLNATDEEARRLAYLENTTTQFEKPLENDEKDDIMMILWDMAQSAYLKQSQRLAEIIQDELNTLLGTADRGIKQAPFKVLTGVASPAVLVEVAFISNPDEEKNLVTEGFQQRIAQAIFQGIARYIKLTS